MCTTNTMLSKIQLKEMRGGGGGEGGGGGGGSIAHRKSRDRESYLIHPFKPTGHAGTTLCSETIQEHSVIILNSP